MRLCCSHGDPLAWTYVTHMLVHITPSTMKFFKTIYNFWGGEGVQRMLTRPLQDLLTVNVRVGLADDKLCFVDEFEFGILDIFLPQTVQTIRMSKINFDAQVQLVICMVVVKFSFAHIEAKIKLSTHRLLYKWTVHGRLELLLLLLFSVVMLATNSYRYRRTLEPKLYWEVFFSQF